MDRRIFQIVGQSDLEAVGCDLVTPEDVIDNVRDTVPVITGGFAFLFFLSFPILIIFTLIPVCDSLGVNPGTEIFLQTGNNTQNRCKIVANSLKTVY